MNIIKKIYHIFFKRDIVSKIYLKKFETFGKNSVLYKPLYIKGKENICIGDNTTILNNARIQVYNDITKLNSKLYIGNSCYIGYNNSFLVGENIIIEDGVLMASNILISSENHSINPELDKYFSMQPLVCKEIKIGEGSWIGEKVSILAGVEIGKKCIIGCNSVVTKNIPDYSIAVGNPARVIKQYNFNRHEWEFLK